MDAETGLVNYALLPSTSVLVTYSIGTNSIF